MHFGLRPTLVRIQLVCRQLIYHDVDVVSGTFLMGVSRFLDGAPYRGAYALEVYSLIIAGCSIVFRGFSSGVAGCDFTFFTPSFSSISSMLSVVAANNLP